MNGSAGKKKSNARYYVPVAAVAAGTVTARLAWRRLLRRGLPLQYDQVALPALDQPVEILRDTWGVPHIYACSVARSLFCPGIRPCARSPVSDGY